MEKIICWICEVNIANSEEHKFKSSDIRSNYGKKFKRDVILYKENQEISLISYKDKNIKFPKLICTRCNNIDTQEADNAYSNFVNYIDDSFENTKRLGYVDYGKIYPNWELEKDNLYRYIAKQAGCRISAFDQELLPKNLAKFILGKEKNSSLKLLFIQKEGIEILKRHVKKTDSNKFVHLANGSTILFKSSVLDCFHGWISYNWLTIHWFCGDLSESILLNDPKSPIEKVVYQKFSIENKDESIHPIDWIETYNISNDKDRLEFIRKTLFTQ